MNDAAGMERAKSWSCADSHSGGGVVVFSSCWFSRIRFSAVEVSQVPSWA